MNLTWHIIKKDLTRLRYPVLLWLALLAGQSLFSVRLLSLHGGDMNWYAEAGMGFNVLVAVTLLVGFLLMSALVLSDPLVGAEMFWVTRPISGARLLRAKLLAALLIFGLVPLLTWLPWWIYCDFSAAEIAGAAWRILWVQAIAVVPAFVLASLVGQTGRFVIFSVLTGVASLVAVMNFVTWGGFHSLSARLLETRLVLTACLLLVFGAAVIWRQYHRRRFGSSAAVLGSGIALSFVMMVGWPWSVSAMWPDRSAPVPGSDAIVVEIRDAVIAPMEIRNTVIAPITTATGDTETEGVIIQVVAKGVPDEFAVAGGLASVTLKWPDGFSITRDDLWLGPNWSDAYDEYAPVSKALGVPLQDERKYHWDPETRAKIISDQKEHPEKSAHWRTHEIKVGETTLRVTLAATLAVASRIRTAPPACTIAVRLALRKPELLFEMPWQGDTQMARRGARLHILGIAPLQRGPYGREDQRGSGYLTTVVSATAPSLGSLHLYKLNRAHGAIAFLGESQVFTALPVAANMQALYFDLSSPRLWRTDKWVDSPGWLASSTLVAVAYRPAGTFPRELHTDRLTVRP